MTVAEAQRRGYGIANTATRLLLRSPHGSPETYTQNVSVLQLSVAISQRSRQPSVKSLAAPLDNSLLAYTCSQ